MILSTHVLDIARGTPAGGIAVTLHRLDGESRVAVARGITDADGRVATLADAVTAGTYEIVFEVGPYFATTATASLYDAIPVRIVVEGGARHYHVPLLLSPWGYSTYRGS